MVEGRTVWVSFLSDFEGFSGGGFWDGGGFWGGFFCGGFFSGFAGFFKELSDVSEAFVSPGEEDFGITPLEAQSCGRPVIAYGKGGVLETVIPGRTGEIFPEQTKESMKEVIKRFDPSKYDPVFLRKHAMKFNKEYYRKAIVESIEDKMRRGKRKDKI